MRGEEKKNQTSSFSRSRAIGVMVLVLGLFLFQIAVFVFERVQIGKKGQKGEPAGYEDARQAAVASAPPELFEFNPNTIATDSLCLLGFSEKQAQSIIKYRNKGGKFRKKEDFARMYVVSEQMYNKLSGYIVIENGKPQAQDPGQHVRKSVLEQNESAELERKKVPEKESGRQSANEQGKHSGKRKDSLKRVLPVVELNRADSAALVTLYGIGGHYARKILAYRARVGNFYAPEQLLEIEGIDSVRYAGFAKRVKADPALVRRFSLDTAGKHFLMGHPYIGAYAARGIIFMREKFGAEACTLENLVKERVLTAETAKKLWYYVE